ncbi:hypothetical protein V8E53_012159 [Lactarius tabidus]
MTPWLRPSLSSGSWLPAHGPGQEITKQGCALKHDASHTGGRQLGCSPNRAGGDENTPPLLCPSSHAEGKQRVVHRGKGEDAHGGGSTCSPGEGAGGQPREWVDPPAPSLRTQKPRHRVEGGAGLCTGGGRAEGVGVGLHLGREEGTRLSIPALPLVWAAYPLPCIKAHKRGSVHLLHTCCMLQMWKKRRRWQPGGGVDGTPTPLPTLISYHGMKGGPVLVSSRVVLHFHVLFVHQWGWGCKKGGRGKTLRHSPPFARGQRVGEGGSCLHIKKEVEGGNRDSIPFLLFLVLLWRWGPKAEGVNRCKQGGAKRMGTCTKMGGRG